MNVRVRREKESVSQSTIFIKLLHTNGSTNGRGAETQRNSLGHGERDCTHNNHYQENGNGQMAP